MFVGNDGLPGGSVLLIISETTSIIIYPGLHQ